MAKLAIIPARGGSKRIPKKNSKDFLGKPIIAYSIEAAIQSTLFDEVMVSTDNREIAEIARSYGAEVPFFRSDKNADDHATLSEVIDEVLADYRKKAIDFDSVCCLLPTAPFVTSNKITAAYEILIEQNRPAVFPVIAYSYPIQRSLKIEKGGLEMADPSHLNTRSQDLPERYHDSGQFYWLKTKEFMAQGKIFMPNAGAIIISELESQDIDTDTDWKLAEIKYQMMLSNGEENTL